MSDLRERFGEPADPGLREFATSLPVDLQMLDEDLDGSIAHATMLGEGGIVPLVDRVFTLDQVADAHRCMEQSAHFGKIVLTP